MIEYSTWKNFLLTNSPMCTLPGMLVRVSKTAEVESSPEFCQNPLLIFIPAVANPVFHYLLIYVNEQQEKKSPPKWWLAVACFGSATTGMKISGGFRKLRW